MRRNGGTGIGDRGSGTGDLAHKSWITGLTHSPQTIIPIPYSPFPIPFLRAAVIVLLLLFPSRLPAQSQPPSPSSQGAASAPSIVSSLRAEEPYLLPQTIFVGDQGRLVVPLGQAFAGVEPFIKEAPEKLPNTPDVVIKRVELERRGGVSRLLIDFIPYAPGTLSFPALEFPSAGAAPLTLSGLEVTVASILTQSNMTLSEPAPLLAVPGTSFLIYGTVIVILVILFAGIGGSLWGRRHFRELWERFRRRHLLRVMANFLRRMEQEGDLKEGKPDFYLSILSGEFREFLSLFTGVNCRSLTAEEFLDLPLGYTVAGDAVDCALIDQNAFKWSEESLLTPVFLYRLFRTWDTLRFSGRGVDKIDLFQALKATENFIIALDKAEREKPFSKPVREAAPLVEGTAGGEL